MKKIEDTIQSLTSDLKPVRPALSPQRLAALWLLVCTVFVVAITQYIAPIRVGAWQQLVSTPRFALETVTAILAVICFALIVFRSSFPGMHYRRLVGCGLVMLALWVTQYLVGLWRPAISPLPLGERHWCWLEIIVYSLPLMVLALLMTRHLYPMTPLLTACSYCLAGGILPAVYMQLACMYEASHILIFHILPGLSMTLLGFLFARCYTKSFA